MGRTVKLTATVTSQNGGLYCARCVQVEVAGEGRTVDDALDRLRVALEEYFQRKPLPSIPSEPPIVVPIEVRLPR
ncbi:type II toxin-antitoxin system HicB family antitoxin [Microbispora sp. NPDC049125]|uniref:type II toxin-antitoxin system HicB family antitoxin n=1 Tax=Microbispora sp. NPDC049125 TaxID=3154929 RepID=UPI003466D422